MGLPETERGPAGGEPGAAGPPFFGSSPIAGGALVSPVGADPSVGFGAGFWVAVGGGAMVPSTTGRRESFDETMPFGISWLGSGSPPGRSVGSLPGSSAVAAGAADASLAATGSGAAADSGVVGAGGAASAAAGSAAAAFLGGGFLVETALLGFGACSAGASSTSSTGTTLINPSRSALRRTRSA